MRLALRHGGFDHHLVYREHGHRGDTRLHVRDDGRVRGAREQDGVGARRSTTMTDLRHQAVDALRRQSAASLDFRQQALVEQVQHPRLGHLCRERLAHWRHGGHDRVDQSDSRHRLTRPAP